MSDSTQDGGPAFPIQGFCADASGALAGTVVNAAGMTLRDYFAAKALQGIVTAGMFNQEAEDMMKKVGIQGADKVENFVAFMAYGFADAMLAERAKQP